MSHGIQHWPCILNSVHVLIDVQLKGMLSFKDFLVNSLLSNGHDFYTKELNAIETIRVVS